METHRRSNRSTWRSHAVVAGIVLSVVGVVFSLTLGLASFLLFKVAPVLLVGWIVVKLVQKSSGRGALSEADRKWLEGE